MTSALAELLMRLADAPVLPLARFDAKRKELVLCAAEPRTKGPLCSVIWRASPRHELVVLSADDALDLVDELSRPEYAGPLGGIRLPEPGRVSVDLHGIWNALEFAVDGEDYQSALYFSRAPRVDQFGAVHRGGVWWGYERRRDALKRWWRRDFRDLVTDDYGQLVSSETGEAP